MIALTVLLLVSTFVTSFITYKFVSFEAKKIRIIADAMKLVERIKNASNADDIAAIFVDIHKFARRHQYRSVQTYKMFHYESLQAMAHQKIKVLRLEMQTYSTRNPRNNY